MASLVISTLLALTLEIVGQASALGPQRCSQVLKREDLNSSYVDVEIGVSVLRTFNEVDDALNYAQLLYYLGEDVQDVKLFVNESMTLIEDISFTPLTVTGLEKRWSCSNAPLGTHFTQRQVAQDGYWWGDWKKSSPCYYSGNSGDGGSITRGWLITNTKSISSGFDVGFSSGVAKAHFGFELSQLLTKSGQFTCKFGGSDRVSIWSQTQCYWSDQQTQKCVRQHYGGGGCKCGAWSAYIHGDVPVKNRDPNLGCSGGDHAHC